MLYEKKGKLKNYSKKINKITSLLVINDSVVGLLTLDVTEDKIYLKFCDYSSKDSKILQRK